MNDLGLKVVDGLKLDPARRALLRPGESVADRAGRQHRLPRFFYEIDSWEQAKATEVSPHFRLAELISVDCREAPLLLETFPHYVPCAVSILCQYLEAFRQRVDALVFVSANGGYRSPAHALSRGASAHMWATAANIYRVGDTWLDTRSEIENFADVARAVAPEFFAKPFGHEENASDDHFHVDIGYVSFV
ncbi:MAG TPA: hypothetical protein VEO95_10470, partial [Chthoniobacteraceae bacterium]|nr:hypothetical protein [Chthoniobacteraceae bacterium]